MASPGSLRSDVDVFVARTQHVNFRTVSSARVRQSGAATEEELDAVRAGNHLANSAVA